MFNIHQLSEKIEDLSENRLTADAFEEWFVSESWGHYNVGPDSLSRAIAAVHHVLYSYESDEIEESRAAEELADAIRPFVPASFAAVSVAPPGKKPQDVSFAFGSKAAAPFVQRSVGHSVASGCLTFGG